MVDAERIKELEVIDRRLVRRRRATIIFFVALSVMLTVYAVHIERKIHKLSEGSGVVIYKQSTVGQDASFNEGVVTEPDTEAVIQATENSDAVTVHPSFFEEATSGTDESSRKNGSSSSADSQIYYVTASGKKYHKADCSYLTSSKREITADEIIRGGYTACSRCIKE